MIVEDEVIIAECLAMELKIAGYEVVGNFTTGADAIKAVQESKPEIIMMDIHLSDNLSGIETAQIIRQNSNSFIIFMTGFDKNEVEQQCKDIKNVAILEKPVETYQVEDIIEKL